MRGESHLLRSERERSSRYVTPPCSRRSTSPIREARFGAGTPGLMAMAESNDFRLIFALSRRRIKGAKMHTYNRKRGSHACRAVPARRPPCPPHARGGVVREAARRPPALLRLRPSLPDSSRTRRRLPRALQRRRHAEGAVRLRGGAARRPRREEAVLPRPARRTGAFLRDARL